MTDDIATIRHALEYAKWPLALPALDRLAARLERAEQERDEAIDASNRQYVALQAAEARNRELTEALERIEGQQARTLDWLRANGVVFDGPLGIDPDNWEHVAFSIYNDLAKAYSIARAVLAANPETRPA